MDHHVYQWFIQWEMGRGLLLSLKNLLFDVRSPWVTSSSGIIVLVLFFFEILYTSKKNCSTNKKSQKVQDLTIRTYIKQYIKKVSLFGHHIWWSKIDTLGLNESKITQLEHETIYMYNFKKWKKCIRDLDMKIFTS